MYLFGGDKPWDESQFTASDDRVRGGRSHSFLTVLPSPGAPASQSRAEFSGNLDITALGGAGFASQRTADGLPAWDLSGYGALVLDVARADRRSYTLTLKDEVLPRRPDGRDQSTVSWEYDFVVGGGKTVPAAAADDGGDGMPGSTKVVVPFGDFKPTYRGKPKPDAAQLDLKNVKRISFMMRSFFGHQEGDFSIVFNSVAVERTDESRDDSIDSVASAKFSRDGEQPTGSGASKGGGLPSWFGRLCGWGS